MRSERGCPALLGDHLADGKAQRKIDDVFFASGDHRLEVSVVDHCREVVLIKLEITVPVLRRVAEKAGRYVRELRPEVGVEIGPEVGKRAVQLLVELKVGRGGSDLQLPRGALGASLGHGFDRLRCRTRFAACPDERKLGLTPALLRR